MSTLADPDLQLRRHREMLVIAVVVVVLALVFQVRDDRVVIAGLPQYPLPPTCMSHELFGVKCPGCGLTRSFVHLAHGDWPAAWQSHRLGWLLAAAVLLQIPYRLLALRRGGRCPLGTWAPRWCGYGLIAALVGNWLLEMLTHHA